MFRKQYCSMHIFKNCCSCGFWDGWVNTGSHGPHLYKEQLCQIPLYPCKTNGTVQGILVRNLKDSLQRDNIHYPPPPKWRIQIPIIYFSYAYHFLRRWEKPFILDAPCRTAPRKSQVQYSKHYMTWCCEPHRFLLPVTYWHRSVSIYVCHAKALRGQAPDSLGLRFEYSLLSAPKTWLFYKNGRGASLSARIRVALPGWVRLCGWMVQWPQMWAYGRGSQTTWAALNSDSGPLPIMQPSHSSLSSEVC